MFKENQHSEAMKGLNVDGFINVPKVKKSGNVYAHEQKLQRKKDLENLQSDFEKYKRILQKKMQKDKNRQNALMKI